MKLLKLLCVCLVTQLSLISCNKGGVQSDILPEDLTDIHAGRVVSNWENLINNESASLDGTNIGVRYLGVSNYLSSSVPPSIAVGAVFPESSFAKDFDKEVTASKKPADLFFNFPDPYIKHMENPRGFEYLKGLKDAMKSEEYKSFKSPSIPYKFRLANLGALSNIEQFFPDNKKFATALQEVCRQAFKMDNVKSLTLGEIVFKGFSVSMDVPAKGLFVDSSTNTDNLIYIRQLTYGVSAYFVIASDHRYQDVLNAFKHSFSEAYEKQGGVLNNSQISLLTISDQYQQGAIKTTFADLKTFLSDPFQGGKQSGYPILCKGCWVKDNAVFVRQ